MWCTLLWTSSPASAGAPAVRFLDPGPELDEPPLEDRHYVPIEDVLGRLPKDRSVTHGIVNGTKASSSEFKGVVLLGGYANGGYYTTFCTGSLIHEEWVLSAAHCLTDDVIDPITDAGYSLTVFWGADVTNFGWSDRVNMSAVYVHPSYDETSKENDIALVELVSGKSNPTLMAVNDDAVSNGWIDEKLMFVGFGVTAEDAEDSGTKRYVETTIVDYDSFFIHIYDGTWNSWGPNYDSTHGTCYGDSGGPGLYETGNGYTIAAVTSHGTAPCPGYSFDTRVDKYISWIEGYVPAIITNPANIPDSDVDTDTDSDTDTDTDSDKDEDDWDFTTPGDEDPDDPANTYEWDDPPRPNGKDYPRVLGCSTSGTRLVAWAMLVFLGARRRVN